MAKSNPQKISKRFVALHKLSAGVSLLAFIVVTVGGLMSEVRMTTLLIRASVVFAVIAILSRMVIRVWSYYEEIGRGEA